MKKLSALLLALVTCGASIAAEPAWWSATSPVNTSIKSGAPANNAGPVNQGQLKNVAKKAALYLNTALPGWGAGGNIDAMVAGFHPSPTDHAPVNLGQLKRVAKPFYDRLIQLGFDTKLSLQSHGAPAWSDPYPWNTTTPVPVSQNQSPAKIGQLKWVFSFNLMGFSVTDTNTDHIPDIWATLHATGGGGNGAEEDFDNDGLSNAWEFKYGMDPANPDENINNTPDCFEDFDGDGITNGAEAAMGLNPYSPDSDKDGLDDRWELKNDFNPWVDDDPNGDRDGDGMTNEDECSVGDSALDDLAGDYTRRVEIWTRMVYSQKDAQGSWQEKNASDWKPYTYIGAQTAEAPKMPSALWLAFLQDGSYRWKGEFYFKNVSGGGPLKIKWVQFEHQMNAPNNGYKQVSEDFKIVAAGDTSGVVTLDYPSVISHGSGIMMSRALDGWPWPEGGFDNYERYSIPAGPPVVLEQPWQMVPDDGAHVSVDLETYANYSGDFHAASTAPQSLDVKIGTEPADFYGTSAWLTLKNTGGLSDNDYVHFFAQDASSQVKVLRASRLTAKNFTVQPYKVICPTTLHAPDPDSLPSSQELQEDLNRIYRQMNITFTVKPYKTITVDYDIGPAIPAGPLQPFVPNMKSNVGNPQNGFLDATVFEDVLTREENAVYNEEYHSTDNASLYFLGDVIRYHDFVGPVNAPACRPIYGYTRRVTHRAIISFLKDKPLLLHTAAHEIGHMNIGVNGKGLYHPRLDDGRGPNSGNPAIPAYPLMRLSDDRKRLMFPHPTSLEYLDMGQPARYPAVLLYDEWKRYRGE